MVQNSDPFKKVVQFGLIIVIGLFQPILSNVCLETKNCQCTELRQNYYSANCRGALPVNLSHKVKKVTMVGNIPVLNKLNTAGLMSVEHLNMTNCFIHFIEDGFLKVTGFRVLVLSNNELTSVEKNTFNSLMKLEELYLDRNNIIIIEEDSFKDLTKLKVLSLKKNKLKEITFFQSMPPNLISVDLSDNQILTIPTTVQNNLTKLDLCGNEISQVNELFRMIKLKNLCLSGLKYLLMNGLSPHIEELSITGNQQTPTLMTLQISATIGEMKNLSVLQIESFVISSFNFFEKLNNLETLSLKSVKLSGSARVANILKKKTELRSLDLTNSPDVTNQLLRSFNIIPYIKFLSLQKNSITSLKGFNCVKYLKKLDITVNPLNCTYDNWEWLNDLENTRSYLVNADKLFCSNPPESKGILLMDAFVYQHHLLSKNNMTVPLEFVNQNESNSKILKRMLLFGGLLLIIVIGVAMFIIIKLLYSSTRARLIESYSVMELSQTVSADEIDGNVEAT